MSAFRQNGQPAILIPGFERAACLAMAVELLSEGFPVVAVCEEGGAARAAGCAAVESPKGNELRAGLEYFFREMRELPGVVVWEAEGGYAAEDVREMAAALGANPDRFAIADRAANPGLNLRARLVKSWAGRLLAVVHGRPVRDPWAGLRAIPTALVPAFLNLKGEGRGFAFNMVLNLQHKGVKALNVPVGAPYTPGEGRERGERVKDIFRILALPFRFISASLVATIADYAVFILTDTVLLKGHWLIANTASRGAGAVVGYFLNRNLVFKRKNDTWSKELVAAAQFALLALFNYGVSSGLVFLQHDLLHIHEVIAKVLTDMLLFVISYTVQREIIFRRKSPALK